MNILILHAVDNPQTVRRAILNHLLFLPKYAPDHRYTYHHIFTPVAEIAAAAFDLIVLDTTFLCYRWSRPRRIFDRIRETYRFIRHSSAVKIAMPQDEYDHSELLDEWLADLGVDVVYSCCFRDRALFYNEVAAKAEIVEGFTGYIDDVDLDLGRRYSRPIGEREIDVGYRANNLGAYFGRIGHDKSVIGRKFAQAAAGSGLRVDVSTRAEDTIVGDAWLRFIGNCRFTLGADSGSSLLDRRGEIKDAISAYMTKYPEAEFDEVEKACFPERDGKHVMTALSPRLFETVIGGSCPLLVQGWYGGMLEPNIHYIPIESNFSNIAAVIERVRGAGDTAPIVERCYADLILNPRFRYSALARAVIGMAERRRPQLRGSCERSMESSELFAAREEATKLRLALQLRELRQEYEPYRAALDAFPAVASLLKRLHRQVGAVKALLWRLGGVNRLVPRIWPAQRKRSAWAPPNRHPQAPSDYRPAVVSPQNRTGSEPIGSGRSICLVSLSRIADDPRVRRQGDAFAAAGWNVIAVGLPGAKSLPPAWPIRCEATRMPSRAEAPERRFLASLPPPAERLLRRVQSLPWYVAQRVNPAVAFRIHWARPLVHHVREIARDVAADVWLANDWTSLPIAAEMASASGGVYGYDTHELAVEEHSEEVVWRLVRRPIIKAIEGALIREAAVVSTVSSGIAEDLQSRYRLPSLPIVSRNTPNYVAIEPRSTGARIRVLYHGVIVPGRNLEALIESVGAWRSEFDLTLRGPGDATYLAALRSRIAAHGLDARVTLAPPVPMTELIVNAAVFDVGIHVLVGHSRQNNFALPNKFFEYAMAGMALCVSNLPEMARLVRHYDMGVIVSEASPAGIADAVNQLDRSAIDRYRANALKAARDLCWESESQHLLQAYDRLTGDAAGRSDTRV